VDAMTFVAEGRVEGKGARLRSRTVARMLVQQVTIDQKVMDRSR